MHHTGTVQASIDYGSKTIHVFCDCNYMARINIADLPRVTWKEAQDRMLCPKCGQRGKVQIRFYHDEHYSARACNIIDGEIVR